MHFTRYLLLVWLLFAGALPCPAQTKKIGQLNARLQASANRQERLDNLLALFEEYQSLNRDTLYELALQARELAAQQPGKEKKGLAAMALADAYMLWGWKDSSLAAIEPVLGNEKDYTPGVYLKMQRHYAMIYGNTLQYEKALSILYPALTKAEQWKDTLNMATIMNSVGSITMTMGKQQEALGWIYNAAALVTGHPRYQAVLAAVYTNAANMHMNNGNSDSATYYIERALPLCREAQNLHTLATAQRINASLLTDKKRFAEAEAALKEMLAIRRTTSGEDLFVEDNLRLADFYAQSGQLEKAIALCKDMLDYKDEATGPSITTVKNPKVRLEYWGALAAFYKQANRLNDYQDALEHVITLKDSFYEANSAQAIADAEIKYKVQKNENTILQQKYSLQRNRMFLYGLLALLTMLLVIAYFIWRDNRRRQQLKMEMAMANEQVKADAAVKNAEEKERLRIAADLHDNIGAYASAIQADVEKISSGSPGNTGSLQNLQQHSQEIMNSLRDTIWALNKEHITITGISDRIKNYISKLQPSYSQVQLNITETVTHDRRINSRAALNIFRIVQEAVHNALKHSGATHVHISIYSAETAAVTVADDGRGMDVAVQAGKGNGINNMQARAAESGLQLSLQSAVGQGTAVSLHLPTTN